MMRRLAVLLIALALLSLPLGASAQVDIEGSTSLSVAGSGILGGDFSNLTNIFGINKFVAGGLEIGTFIIATISSSSGADTDVSGFFFGKLRYNMIGESMTVPFFEIGMGTQLDEPAFGSRPTLLQGGGGFKKFISDNVSFDVSANFQGQLIDGELEFSDAIFLQYGLTIYIN